MFMLGLISGLKERMTEADGAVNPNVLSVGTAERKKFRHARQHAAIHRRTIQIDYPDYAAHRSFPGLLRDDASQCGIGRYGVAAYAQLRCSTIPLGQRATEALERIAAPNLTQRIGCYVAYNFLFKIVVAA